MKDMKEESLVDGFGMGPLRYVAVKVNDKMLQFNADTGFGKLFTNPLKTDNGQTVGERNRAALHRRLDAWLDGTWEENKDD